ncbi:hypothetical protein ACQEVZ_49175 [Dactylosporangium sp. CA-152071]|uniref:hypothetical protein n=1 Tax=Dactylosporangium sp. CA-152071 TaxID=3239933 RepID=UPI003D924FFD
MSRRLGQVEELLALSAHDAGLEAAAVHLPPRTYESYVRDTAADWSAGQRPVAD